MQEKIQNDEKETLIKEKEDFEASIQNTISSKELNPITNEEKSEMDSVILAEHNYENDAKVVLKNIMEIVKLIIYLNN